MPDDARIAKFAEILHFCPGCFASSEDGSYHACDAHYCYNCGNNGTVQLPRWAVESIRAQASWVGKRYYPHEEDHITQAELKALRPLMPDHATDEWELKDWAQYTDEPERPQPGLTLKRDSGEGRVISTTANLPYPYTKADVEAAKARLRIALPISYCYRTEAK